MVKPEWGRKRICPSCAMKYYDFNRSPIICPSCNEKFEPDLYLKSRKGKVLSPKQDIKKNENLPDVEDDDNDIEGDDNDIETIENKNLENEEDLEIDDDISFVVEDENDEDGIEITNEEIEK